MVEVFKTNITEKCLADKIKSQLMLYFPEIKVNFDLEDCDRILRVENCSFETKEVIQIINQNGFYCEALE